MPGHGGEVNFFEGGGVSSPGPAEGDPGQSFFEEPIPKKKKKTPIPVTPVPQVTPATPTPALDSAAAFQAQLAVITQNFEQRLAAIQTTPISPGFAAPSFPAPTALPQLPTLLGAAAPAVAELTPPPVPVKRPAQGVTPAQAANRQNRRAAATTKPRTILTSGRGLLDTADDQSRRAKKTLLGA